VIKQSHLVRLRDILENIDAVTEMTAGVDLAVYRGEHGDSSTGTHR
jgi:uncharacterized protein with HEPN domain